MTRNTSSTRRGFLAATGTTLLAGCNALDTVSDGSTETVPSSRLPDVADDGGTDPVVAETIPITVEQDELNAARERVTDLLATLPLPFGPGDVPNGYVRHRLLDAASDATGYVEDARTAASPLSALRSLREARTHARYAAAGWAFVEQETTAAELRTEREETVTEVQQFQANHEYLGTDPVRAALVHAPIERNVEHVLVDEPPHPRERSGAVLTAAEWGEHAESARTLLADSRYLFDQFSSSLPADAGTIGETLATTAESIADDLGQRRGELPPEPTEGDRELVWRLRDRLRDDAERAARGVDDAPGPASALLAATEGLTDALAYDRLEDRIEGGERFGVEDASGVETARSAALEAIRTALAESPRPELVRPVLADAATTVRFADEQLAGFHGDVRLTQLDHPIRRYTTATLRARSVSTACRQVIDALER